MHRKRSSHSEMVGITIRDLKAGIVYSSSRLPTPSGIVGRADNCESDDELRGWKVTTEKFIYNTTSRPKRIYNKPKRIYNKRIYNKSINT